MIEKLLTAVVTRAVIDIRAEREYFKIEKQLRGIWRQLTRENNPARRADLLIDAAEIEQQLARLHLKTFGPDPIPWEGGRDLAESIELSARLLRLMASVERGIADGGNRVRTDDRDLEAVAGETLDLIAAATDPTDRRCQHQRFYAVVEPVVGGQAAEVLACLPAPH